MELNSQMKEQRELQKEQMLQQKQMVDRQRKIETRMHCLNLSRKENQTVEEHLADAKKLEEYILSE